jgi:hypothetical protein
MLSRKIQVFFVFGTFVLLLVAIAGRKPDLPPTIAALFPDSFRALVQKPFELSPIAPVSLVPTGSGAVDLYVLRNGRTGPVVIEVTDLPDGVTASVAPVQSGESTTRLEFTASDALGDKDLEATVSVRASVDKDSASQHVLLRVPRVGRPDFAPLGRIILKPGMEAPVAVGVQRNGFEGPLVIRAIDSPGGVDCPETRLPEGTLTADLHIKVANDAAEGDFPIALEMSAYGRSVVSDLPLVIDSTPFRVHSLRVVELQPGSTVTVDVPVERNSHAGPLTLTGIGLPAQIEMQESVVPAGQKTASLQFQANASATPGVQAVKIRAQTGRLEDEGTLVLRIIDEHDDGSLPREIVAADAIGRITAVGSLGSRTSASGKEFLQKFYGTSPEAQDAIASGLKWLSTCQRENGSWTLAGVTDVGDSGRSSSASADDPVAATALALLPFLAEGVTHRRSSISSKELASYRSLVERGLQFLARNQNSSTDDSNGAIGSNLMGHTLATLALAEAYGLTKDDRLRPFLKSALTYLLSAQEDRDGGWREQPDGPEELSTTAWDVMALRNAQYAHVPVPKKALKRTEMFMDDCGAGAASDRQSLYANTPGSEAAPNATASGLFVRQLLGWQKSDPSLTTGCQYLMTHLPPERGDATYDIDYFFFATQVLRNMEGTDFDLWNYLVQKHLVSMQDQKEPFSGSWRPRQPGISLRSSRMYVTALSLLTLQVSYRHLPFYRPVKLWADDARDDNDDEDATDDDESKRP